MSVEINELLETLGLTEYEAKTLSALFKLRESEAPDVSRAAQVPKTRVYDVLDKLTKRGLVIEIYGRPKKYRVLGPEEVFDALLNERKKEMTKLEKRVSSLKQLAQAAESAEEDGMERVMKVKDKQDFFRILAQEIELAKKEITGFARIGEEHTLVKTALHSAADKKVKTRILSRVPNHVMDIAKKYSEKGIELKHADHGLNAYIIDNRKVVLGLSDFSKEKPEYHFTILHNKAMASALQSYFDSCWKKAREI